MTDCEPSCCCEPDSESPDICDKPWIIDSVQINCRSIPLVSTILATADRIGSWKVRWSIGRSNYTVNPGLYGVGQPTPDSPVFVSANYKMSFDRLRASLHGRAGWILVLDTNGINVWCAAGKGTFGTAELINQINETGLADVVSHKKLIAPQLGAPGVSAHEVKKATCFSVTYGPVRCEDLPAYLDGGMKATPAMRKVQFGFTDRAVLIPVELVQGFKYFIGIYLSLLLLSGIRAGVYHISMLNSLTILWWTLAGYLGGAVLVPALLPYLPGRMFATKGIAASMLFLPILYYTGAFHVFSPLATAALFLLSSASASFAAMNFTGCSTYTSVTGVRREVKLFLSAQAVLAVHGAVMWIVAIAKGVI